MSDCDESDGLRVRQVKTILVQPDVRITHTILDVGQEIPWHSHTNVADTFYGIRGDIRIMLRDPAKEVALRRGATYQTSSGRPHRVVNAGTSAAEFFLIQGIGSYDFRRL